MAPPEPQSATKQLLLRADSDESIGAGHVMRSLAVARRWIAAGGAATLLGRIGGDRLRQRVSDAGVTFRPLQASPLGNDDLAELVNTLEQLSPAEPAWVIVDGYGFDEEYHAAIRRHGFPLLVIDDLADLPRYHADVLLNQNLGAESLTYYADTDTRRLIGLRYALLQPEFDRWRDRPRETPDVATKLLVTVGGGDPHGATALILDALNGLAIDSLEITVVAGPAGNQSAVFNASSKHTCRVVEDVRDMASLMASMDLAVTGGGSTCWEMAFLGLPAIVLELSDNQRRSSRALAEAGAVENAGAVETQEATLLARRIQALCLDRDRRLAMSDAGRKLVDGEGGQRIVRRLGLGLPSLQLRPATAADSRAMWLLASEPSVRQQSFNPSPIAWEAHEAWFEKMLASPSARTWLMAGEAGLAAQVRYEVKGEHAEIGISVAPSFRGFGLAARILASTWANACLELGVSRARGIVFTTNRLSAAAFREAGFAETSDTEITLGHECHVFTRALES